MRCILHDIWNQRSFSQLCGADKFCFVLRLLGLFVIDESGPSVTLSLFGYTLNAHLSPMKHLRCFFPKDIPLFLCSHRLKLRPASVPCIS